MLSIHTEYTQKSVKKGLLLKFIISIAMLLLVASFTDFASLKSTILQIPITAAFIVVVGYLVGQLISTYRWWLIAKAGGLNVSYFSTLKAYFIGMFVNCFGLGVVGGDVARGLLLAQGQSLKLEALSSVAADRFIGLAVLALMGAFSALVLYILGFYTQLIIYPLVLLGVGVSIFAAWFIGPVAILKLLPASSGFGKKISEILNVFPSDVSTLVNIVAISVVFHSLQLALTAIMGFAVGSPIPAQYLLVSIPLVNIASTLPISWNGLGVRENAYAFFLVPAGIMDASQAIAMGAIWLFAVTVSSAIGGVVGFLTRDFGVLSENKVLKDQAN